MDTAEFVNKHKSEVEKIIKMIESIHYCKTGGRLALKIFKRESPEATILKCLIDEIANKNVRLRRLEKEVENLRSYVRGNNERSHD